MTIPAHPNFVRREERKHWHYRGGACYSCGNIPVDTGYSLDVAGSGGGISKEIWWLCKPCYDKFIKNEL